MPFMGLPRHYLMYLPRRLWLSRLIKKSADLPIHDQRVIVILSTDTEFDPPGRGGWWKRPYDRLLDGLPRFVNICDRHDASATFFCEAKLIEAMPDLFRALALKHEIGCHSYNHEWLGTNPPARWIRSRHDFAVLSVEEKARVLKRAAWSIQNSIGKKPTSFKAPFNSIDHPSTLVLLEQAGFNTDSSLPYYNNESFAHPLRIAEPRHLSDRVLWSEGRMHLLEVPFSTRLSPRFFHPLDFREEIRDTVAREMKLGLRSVEIQCRIDALAGRDISLVHITSHPWEFSAQKSERGDGKINARRLDNFLDQLISLYDVTFLNVSEFTNMWESEYCPIHSHR
jgi:peptidoglycan/xylan/chitin deacetylase (PgdA/CDA1 family)